MEVEQLFEFAESILDQQVKTLLATKNIMPIVHIITPDSNRADEVLFIDPPTMNSGTAKTALGKRIRERIAALNAVAVVQIFDTFLAHFDPLDPAAKAKAELIHELSLTVVEAESIGLCQKRECLLAQVETRVGNRLIMQFYHRDDKGKVTLDERKTVQAGVGRERLSGYFTESNDPPQPERKN